MTGINGYLDGIQVGFTDARLNERLDQEPRGESQIFGESSGVVMPPDQLCYLAFFGTTWHLEPLNPLLRDMWLSHPGSEAADLDLQDFVIQSVFQVVWVDGILATRS
jgi:hypothetical protein